MKCRAVRQRSFSPYESTGSRRKDAGLRAVRQLFTLIDSARFPHLFEHYEGPRKGAGDGYCEKMRHVRGLVARRPQDRVAIGLRRKEVFGNDYLAHWAGFLSGLGREVFVAHLPGLACKLADRERALREAI